MKWTISSHKLVHFNSRHKRLRFLHYQGSSSPEQSEKFKLYEKAASFVIEMLDASLCSLPKGSVVVPMNQNVNNCLENNDTEDNVQFQVYFNKTEHEILKKFLEYCKSVANFEEREELKNTIDEILSLLVNNINNITLNIPRKLKLELLNVMPVLPHWDVMGLLRHEVGNKSILKEMQDFQEPFYLQKTIYKTNESKYKGSKSQEILGYPVMVQFGYADIALPEPVFSYTTEEDYFTFCFDPNQGGIEELEQYKIYGKLYDAIEKNNQEKANQDVCSYTLIYPITTPLGVRHFWHISLLPERTEVSIKTLEQAWRFIHKNLNWPLLKTLVSASLEQLDWSYAQSIFLRKKIEDKLEVLFADHAMMYFPMIAFEYKGNKRGYEKYKPDKLLLGYEWRTINEIFKDEDYIEGGSSGKEYKFIPDASSWNNGIIPPVVIKRFKHILEHQLDLADKLRTFNENQKRQDKEKKEKIKKELMNWLESQSVVFINFDQIDSCMPFGTFVFGDCFITTYKEATRCLLDKDLSEEISEQDFARVRPYFEKGLVTQISRIIECNPVKGLTHTDRSKNDDNINNNLEELKRSISVFKNNKDYNNSIASKLKKFTGDSIYHDNFVKIVDSVNSIDNNKIISLGPRSGNEELNDLLEKINSLRNLFRFKIKEIITDMGDHVQLGTDSPNVCVTSCPCCKTLEKSNSQNGYCRSCDKNNQLSNDENILHLPIFKHLRTWESFKNFVINTMNNQSITVHLRNSCQYKSTNITDPDLAPFIITQYICLSWKINFLTSVPSCYVSFMKELEDQTGIKCYYIKGTEIAANNNLDIDSSTKSVLSELVKDISGVKFFIVYYRWRVNDEMSS